MFLGSPLPLSTCAREGATALKSHVNLSSIESDITSSINATNFSALLMYYEYHYSTIKHEII